MIMGLNKQVSLVGQDPAPLKGTHHEDAGQSDKQPCRFG